MPTSKNLKPLWKDQEASKLPVVEQQVYRANRLGDDLSITNTGGGNTSCKVTEVDPITGESVEVLWVKGSGGDLRTAKKDGFASLYMTKLNRLKEIYRRRPDNGPKSKAEDDMVALYPQCTFNLNPRAASIDTPLHGFVPFKEVDHMHPNAVIAVAAAAGQERLCKEIYGDDLFYLPWQRPGFDLALKIEDGIKAHPKAKGVLMGGHGVMNWANDGKACYDLTLSIIDRAANFIDARDKGDKTFGGSRFRSATETDRTRVLAEILPWLRGQVSQQRRFIATVQADEKILRFVNSVDAPRLAALGTSCPDHFLRTKIKPLYVAWAPETGDIDALKKLLSDGLVQYRKDYAAYYDRCKRPDSPAMRDQNPTVVLIPGIGMIAFGKNKSESRTTAEFYNCAVEVMRGAEAIDRYVALAEQEAFDIEYWALEEAKLRRMPAEKELDRQVIVVVGAGNGIGKEVAFRLVKDGAHIVCVDRDETAARATAQEIIAKYGDGIGVAGTGLSGCGPALGLTCDITNRDSVARMLSDVVIAYGGIDGVAVTAGVFVAPDKTGHISDEQWATTFAVNVTGSYIVSDEAMKIFRRQGTKANIVLTTSANAVVAKKGSLAYDASKAAANHLVRELAIEGAPLVRVNAVAPATVVKGSTMFPRDRVISSLSKYEIAFADAETTEDLRDKLALYYAKRTLTQTPIEPADQAEAMFLFFTNRLAKTTGQVIHVDGGLADGMLR